MAARSTAASGSWVRYSNGWLAEGCERSVDLGERYGASQRGEGAALDNFLRGLEEPGPGSPGQRPADADPPHAGRGQLGHRGEIAAGEDVHRLRRDRLHHRRDLLLAADAGRVEALRAGFDVRRESP